jgi:hypothetical protein
MVSVFDVEEVGAEVVAGEIEVESAVAQAIVDACSAKAKVVAEQQQRDKEEKERVAREQAALGETGSISAGDAAADAILGGSGGESDSAAQERVKDILGS